MEIREYMKIVMLGAGNVGSYMSRALDTAGYKILQCYSRTGKSARELSGLVGCEACTDTRDVRRDADLYIIALSDDAVVGFINSFSFPKNAMAVHTSGSLDMSLFKDRIDNYGVFYPVQTINKQAKVDPGSIPICIEASNNEMLEFLAVLAGQIGSDHYHLSSHQRHVLHLAAVFSNNFVNHLYYIAADLMEKHDLPFDLLLPLIEETAQRVQKEHPADLQTGPAKRNDKMIIKEHLEFLSDNEQYKRIYSELSKSILILRDKHRDK